MSKAADLARFIGSGKAGKIIKVETRKKVLLAGSLLQCLKKNLLQKPG